MKYRLYIDEVGNSDLHSSSDPNHRYLSLTGVAFSLDYVDQVVFPTLESLKRRYFHHHADDPICLHRKEILQKKAPFDSLRDPKIEAAFNEDLLRILMDFQYTVFTAVIDKYEHMRQYSVWQYDPYHYCLEILIERFCFFLETSEATGDVLAESRGGKEDRRLKASFHRHFSTGTRFINPEKIAQRLTSSQLKVKSKSNNIAGLQFADIIAYPSYRAALARHDNRPLPEDFSGKIITILETSKYYRSSAGEIQGYGRKWLP
ncbi:MAG: DUF3800 domain-containing protein [Candidatus Zixiibacteriota bacterium]|nr:MAG: DUF3800 domain-containing protein [candidate division Zixibacteria bacterium]